MRNSISVLMAAVACLFCADSMQAQNDNDINKFTRVWDGGTSGARNLRNLEAGFDLMATD